MDTNTDARHWMQSELRDASAAQADTWEKEGHSLTDPWTDPHIPARQFTPLGRLAFLWLTAPEDFTAKNTALASRLLRSANTAGTGLHQSIDGVPDAALMWLALHRQPPGQNREIDRAATLLYRSQSDRGHGKTGDGGWMDAVLSWMEQSIEHGDVAPQVSFPIARRLAEGCLKHVNAQHKVWGNPKRERWTSDHSCELLQRTLLMSSRAPNAWRVLSSVYGLSEPCYKMLAEGSTTEEFRQCMSDWAGQMVKTATKPGQAARLDPSLLAACLEWPDARAQEHMEKLRSCPEVIEHTKLATPWLHSHLTATATTPAVSREPSMA